jgi:hypothetical protein
MPLSAEMPAPVKKTTFLDFCSASTACSMTVMLPLPASVAFHKVADNVRGALVAIDRNEEFIKLTLAVMMTPECRSKRPVSHETP